MNGMNYLGWTNFIYIRYAEILLVYAEVWTKFQVLQQKYIMQLIKLEIEWICHPYQKILNKEATNNEKRKRIEFTFEGVYYYDTRHWRTTEFVVTSRYMERKSNGEYLW